jgi:CelD/BcsL family acetyltransferase involved in cellulose biosynthesis
MAWVLLSARARTRLWNVPLDRRSVVRVDTVSLMAPAALREAYERPLVQGDVPSRVEGVPLLDALALGPAVWDAVLARSASASPFMSWAWHRAWAEAAPPSEVAASEVLVLRGAGGAIEALLPVGYRCVTYHRVPVAALTWAIGDLGCPDHLDVPAAVGSDIAAFAAVLEERPWDLLLLSNLTPNAVSAARLCEAFAARGYAMHRKPHWKCPYLDLPEDWDGYLASLSPTRRQALGRKERNLKRGHAMAITDYDGDRFDEGWRRLVTLHEQRWNGAGALHHPREERLHRSFAADLAAHQQLWLTTLDLDGEPAAAWYGFACRDTVYFYQSGRDPRWERESVGLVLMGAMIRRAIERGYRRFDFLRGEEAYKRQWTQTGRSTEEITVFRPGWRGRSLRLLDAAAQLRARVRASRQPVEAAGETDHA